MMSFPPASFAATAPPTGTLSSATRAFAAGAAELADVGGAEEVAAEDDELGAADEVAADDAEDDESADDGAAEEDEATDDAAGDDAADDGAATAEEDAAGGTVVAAGVLLAAAAVLELPQAASVSAPAPSPAATRAWRRLIEVRAVPVASVESAESPDAGEWAAAELGIVMHGVTRCTAKRFTGCG